MKNRRKRQRTVFISYSYTTEFGFGFGNTTQYSTDKLHITPKEIRQVEKELKEQIECKSLSILSYQIM